MKPFLGYRSLKHVSTLSRSSQKLLVSTGYTVEKSHDLHDIKVDIFKTRMSSSKTVSLGFQDKRVIFKDWVYGL